MNIYLIIEDGQHVCIAAETMTSALGKARGRYIDELQEEWAMERDGPFDLGDEYTRYEESILESCALVGELSNYVEDGSELQRIVASIDELTAEEANTVTIISGNADFDGPDWIIMCKGGWTDWTELTIPGESRLQCLEKAVELKRKA